MNGAAVRRRARGRSDIRNIGRCPAGALSALGHDKTKCSAYLDGETAPCVEERYGFRGCGLCQTGVPCASGIPAI